MIEPPSPLGLGTAVQMALENNADLAAARREVQAVEATIIQAGVRPNPVVSLEAQDTRRDTRETTFQINQAIELGGKRDARIQAAETNRESAFADFHTRQAELRSTVVAAFFSVLTAQERVRLSQESENLAQRAVLVASRRVAAGKISPVEETKANIAATGVRLELLQARTELAAARRQLAATWGNPSPRFTEAQGELDSLPGTANVEQLAPRLARSPALSRARLEVERRDSLTRLERSRRTPDFTVALGMKRNEELGRNQAIVGVSVPIPLSDRNQGNVLEALRRTDKARDELAALETRLSTDLAQAVEALNSASQEAAALKSEVLPGAKSAYDAASKGFEFGKFGFLDVLDAQRTLLQARTQYLRALANMHRSQAEIERILGEPLRKTDTSGLQ